MIHRIGLRELEVLRYRRPEKRIIVDDRRTTERALQ